MEESNNWREDFRAKREANEDAMLEHTLMRLKAISERTGIDIHDVILYQTLDDISEALYRLDRR